MPAQEALSDEAQRIYDRLRGAFDDELRRMAQLMAGKKDSELLGQTEFEIRDVVHRLGAQVLETAANERVKKGGL